MKLTEIKGEAALDVIAEIIEPIMHICQDDRVINALREDKTRMHGVKVLLKDHKADVITVLAALDGEPVETFKNKMTVFTLPAKVLEFLGDPEIISLFQLAEQTAGVTPSTSASVSITE